uniref:Uncharacterized protein n=1 Tax=Arundo donax TaxID=35708 RepID=A0A0A8YZ12_ARUDO
MMTLGLGHCASSPLLLTRN